MPTYILASVLVAGVHLICSCSRSASAASWQSSTPVASLVRRWIGSSSQQSASAAAAKIRLMKMDGSGNGSGSGSCGGGLVRRPSHAGSSPLRASPNGSAAALGGDEKKPFLIGVAGGTASGKVMKNC